MTPFAAVRQLVGAALSQWRMLAALLLLAVLLAVVAGVVIIVVSGFAAKNKRR